MVSKKLLKASSVPEIKVKKPKEQSVAVQPRNDLILVEREVKDSSATSAGLILMKEDKQHLGRVLAVGQGKLQPNGKRYPIGVSVGDRIAFQPLAGLTVEGKEYTNGSKVLIKEEDVLGVLDEKTDMRVQNKYGM